MANFDDIIQIIIDEEGGFINDNNDPGGRTKYGISQKSYPNLDIESITLEDAKQIYKRDYWDKNKCDLLPNRLALFYFDCCVNQGSISAIKLMQQHLKLIPDGIIGNLTIYAMQNTDLALDYEFLSLRALKYSSTNNFIYYGHGWFNRLFKLSINTLIMHNFLTI